MTDSGDAWVIGIDTTESVPYRDFDRCVISVRRPTRDILLVKPDGRTYLYGRRFPRRLGLFIAAMLFTR